MPVPSREWFGGYLVKLISQGDTKIQKHAQKGPDFLEIESAPIPKSGSLRNRRSGF
jgi:hypothetical protein